MITICRWPWISDASCLQLHNASFLNFVGHWKLEQLLKKFLHMRSVFLHACFCVYLMAQFFLVYDIVICSYVTRVHSRSFCSYVIHIHFRWFMASFSPLLWLMFSLIHRSKLLKLFWVKNIFIVLFFTIYALKSFDFVFHFIKILYWYHQYLVISCFYITI